MKIATLSRNAKLYSTQRLVEAAEERGHTAQVTEYLEKSTAAEKRPRRTRGTAKE